MTKKIPEELNSGTVGETDESVVKGGRLKNVLNSENGDAHIEAQEVTETKEAKIPLGSGEPINWSVFRSGGGDSKPVKKDSGQEHNVPFKSAIKVDPNSTVAWIFKAYEGKDRNRIVEVYILNS